MRPPARSYSHSGYHMHLTAAGWRTLCGIEVDPDDRYATVEAGKRAWDDGRQPHCDLCESVASHG